VKIFGNLGARCVDLQKVDLIYTMYAPRDGSSRVYRQRLFEDLQRVDALQVDVIYTIMHLETAQLLVCELHLNMLRVLATVFEDLLTLKNFEI
jgi:hypothetical protein